MNKFDKDSLQKYLKSGDWKGKAGACMMEGFCKNYIVSSRGNLSTALGLSTEKILPFIKDF